MDVIRKNPVYEDEEASPCIEPQNEQDAGHVRSRCGNMACSRKRCGIISVIAVIVAMAITVGVILAVTMSTTTDHSHIDVNIPPTTEHDNILDVTTAPTTSASTASLVVIGGSQKVYGKWDSLNTVDFYHVSAGSIAWSHTGEPSPSYWTWSGRAVSGTDIYVVGGRTYEQGAFGPSAQYGTYRYSVVNNTWQQLPDIPIHTRNSPVVFIHHDTMYAAYNKDIWSLELSKVNGTANSWSKENITLPHYVYGHNAVVSVGDRVFIFSEYGDHGRAFSKSVISWRPGTDEPWKPVADMNVARTSEGFCSVTDGVDRIWVMAGCRDCLHPGFIEMWRVSTDTWTKLDAVPEYTVGWDSDDSVARICGYHDGYIYAIFGTWGSTPDPRFHIFNTRDNTWSVSDTKLKTNAEWGQSAVIVNHG